MNHENYVLFIMYDISVSTKEHVRAYRKLFNYLQSEGFYQFQESIYIRPISDKLKQTHYFEAIKQRAPAASHIRSFIMTYQAFLKIESISGEDTFAETLIKSQDSVLQF